MILGTDGILETWKKENKKNAIIIDMTTSKPELARRIAMEMEGIGCHGVDAPVSGEFLMRCYGSGCGSA